MLYIQELSPDGTVAVDDTIFAEGAGATAGSRILTGFQPLFDAEAVARLKREGYTIAGKTNVGEFGLDLCGEFSYFGAQLKDGRLAGAAASLVADRAVSAALSVDVNGAPRRAAAISGVDFIKPTYGTVSRYGVIPCACSGEQIGVTAASAETAASLLSVLSGHDPKDGTSQPAERYSYSAGAALRGKKVCVIRELLSGVSGDVGRRLGQCRARLLASGAAVDEISFGLCGAAGTAWQILMCAETCNNLSRYDGVKFGYRAEQYNNIDELYINTRTEGLNFLTKSIILYGSDVLSKNRYLSCYDKSLRVRRLVYNAMTEVFRQYDLVLLPAISDFALSPYDIRDAFARVFEESVYSAIPNLIGIPAMVTSGIQLMAGHFQENLLFSAARELEEELPR